LSGNSPPIPSDRRAQKTQRALRDAFAQLVHSRPYDEIQVGDIVADAEVGRSTFYEHFRGKDDLLVKSMAPMLDVLAAAVSGVEDGVHLEFVLEHFWQNRTHGRYLLAGPPARHVFPLLVRELARRIEQRSDDSSPARKLTALRDADGTFALLRAWLAGEAACSPAELAAVLAARGESHSAPERRPPLQVDA